MAQASPVPPKLGIVAGGGEIPGLIVAACVASGRPHFVLALEGQADPAVIGGAPHAWVRLGAARHARALLIQNEVRELVFVGKVRRPTLAEIRPDWLAAKFLMRVTMKALGDDGLLRAIIGEVEREGATVVGAHEILRDLLAPAGPLGRRKPDKHAWRDIRRGFEAAKGLGRLDIGQAAVVQQGLVLGVEAIEGTDALIDRTGALKRDGLGGVLVKVVKPGQERRIDLPTIGAGTVERAAAAGLRGIAVEAGATLVVGRAAVAAAADRLGLFVVGVSEAGLPPP
jgi:UDP-2,3-diacylglucosamine hydrolase